MCVSKCNAVSMDEDDQLARDNCMDRCLVKFDETKKVVEKELEKRASASSLLVCSNTQELMIYRLLCEDRKNEGSSVNTLGVVSQLSLHFLGNGVVRLRQIIHYESLRSLTHIRVLNRHDESDLSTRIGGNGGEGIANRGIKGSGVVHHLADEGKVEPLALSLRANDTALLQRSLHRVVKGVRVQALCRTYRIKC